MSGGWIDKAFGLNPERSFVEAAMDPFFGKDGAFKVDEDDSQGEVAAKALGTVATMPVWGTALFAGIALDDINNPLHLFGSGAAPETSPSSDTEPPPTEPDPEPPTIPNPPKNPSEPPPTWPDPPTPDPSLPFPPPPPLPRVPVLEEGDIKDAGSDYPQDDTMSTGEADGSTTDSYSADGQGIFAGYPNPTAQEEGEPPFEYPFPGAEEEEKIPLDYQDPTAQAHEPPLDYPFPADQEEEKIPLDYQDPTAQAHEPPLDYPFPGAEEEEKLPLDYQHSTVQDDEPLMDYPCPTAQDESVPEDDLQMPWDSGDEDGEGFYEPAE